MSSLAGRRHRPTAVTDRGRLAVDLARVVRGEVRFDGGSQALYANDASVYHLLAAALSAHRSAAFDVHVLAGSGCGAAEVAGSGFAVVVAGEEAGERVDEVE
jgi:hypothetical protein